MATVRALNGPIGVVGAGYIGHLFVQQFALAGVQVRAWSPGASARTLQNRLRTSLHALAEVKLVELSSIDEILARVTVHDDLASAIAPCAAVMEAVVEDAAVKTACYREIEAAASRETLLWSSTSNFPMTRLATAMTHPERALVVHPVQTQLILFAEVVAGEKTSEESVETTRQFCTAIGLKTIGLRKEIPGFLWNRVWFALLREMLHLVDVGAVDPLELDAMVQQTLQAFIPAFGPLQMTDLIGHDTLRDISNSLYPELATDHVVSRTIEQHVSDGRLGAKSGRGFYDDNDQRLAELTKELYRLAGRSADPREPWHQNRKMSNYVYGGAADIDRAIGFLVALDNSQRNALAVLEFDDAIADLQAEYTKSVADPGYRPDNDFISRLSGYLAMADDSARR